MQIRSAPICTRPLAAPQELRERIVCIDEIGEAGGIRIGVLLIRRSEIPIEMMLRPLCTRRVDLAVVETLSLLSIAEQVIGARDLFELFLGRFVARIKIRMQFLRKLAIRSLDLGGGSRRGNTENLVRIPHDLLRKNFSSAKITTT